MNNRKLELLINRFGEVKQERKIGRCNSPIDGRNLAKVMREKGYDRVSIINAKPPRYQVEACSKNVRFDITLNQYGKITERNRIGECNPAVTPEQIAQLLRKEGFTRINIKQRQNGNFKISTCHQGYEKQIKLNRYGELLEEIDGNKCVSRSVSQISDAMRERGFRKAKFFVEACRHGNKLRIELNRNGDLVGRERIGSC